MDLIFKTSEFFYLHRGLLKNKWKEGVFVLYSDSRLQWYEKASDKKPIGTISLREIHEYLFIGEFTRCMPNRPNLPAGGVEQLLVCIPKNLKRKESQVLWIVFKDLAQLNDWMKSIDLTLGVLSISARLSNQINSRVKRLPTIIEQPTTSFLRSSSMSNMNDDNDDNLRKNKRFSQNFDVNRVQNYFPHINPVVKQPAASEAATHRTSMRLGLDIGDVAEMLMAKKNMNKKSFFSK